MPTTSTPSPDADFVVTRLFDAPRELVYQAWTDPRHLARWWGPRICTCPVYEMDVRPAGLYRITMRMPDGVDYPVTGEFLAVKPPERLVMTMDCTEHPAAWHDMVKPNRGAEEKNPAGVMVLTASFEDVGGRTRLTVSIRIESSAIRQMLKMGMAEGWKQSLDRLDENLSTDAHAAQAAAEREIVVVRIFDAPRELVWDAWTDPKKIVRWYGPNGFTDTIQEMDVRPGGMWCHVLRGPDGMEYPNETRYVEVVKHERISYEHLSWPHHLSTATFDDLGGRTRVTLRLTFQSAERRAEVIRKHNAGEGARQTLHRLADELAKNT